MSTVKRITDLTNYAGVLPYASELFGVYQPLLGWKSKRLEERFAEGFDHEKSQLIADLKSQFSDEVSVSVNDRNELEINIKPGRLKGVLVRSTDSLVLEKISASLPEHEKYDVSIWTRIASPQIIESILTNDVTKFYSDVYSKRPRELTRRGRTIDTDRESANLITSQLRYESSIAGALQFLVESQRHKTLEELFYKSMNKIDQAKKLLSMISATSSSEAFLDLENLDPTEKDHIESVSLSPISVVHLFRQYFFELDTFLGTPERHVWLSPGSSVTLIEEHTRKTVVERSVEDLFEVTTRSETEESVKDEISDAVRQENSKTLNLGASVTATYAKISATGSFDYESSQNSARESSHKSMRDQTQKLSSEIRKNYKTTFKTVSDVTEYSSTQHILANDTPDLINYELRRKMRQVGIQVQDIGTFLCWQTYVDDPGRDLGLSKLIHLAQSPELDGLRHPEEIARLQMTKEVKSVSLPFRATNPEGADKDEVYVDGQESDGNNEGWLGSGDLETIQSDFPLRFVAPKANHELRLVEVDPLGKPVTASIVEGTLANLNGQASFTLHLDTVNFEGSNNLQINVILHWEPNEEANREIDAKNEANTANFKEEEKATYESAYLETVRDRVNAVSDISSRVSAELREEERIVVYRKLIQEMLLNKVSAPNNRTRHVLAELINSIFDVEKMLYFVAPEWWRPRLHQSRQQLQQRPAKTKRTPAGSIFAAPNLDSFTNLFATEFAGAVTADVPEAENPTDLDPDIMGANTVGWGDIDDLARDNYYITEESTPAKFGSSLGWLMQLDGDNRRNAFLNSPWVKAVIPIRPGREKAAINWLKAVEGMNGITDDVLYRTDNANELDINGNPLDGQKMIDVLVDLAKKIERKHKESLEQEKYPKAAEVSDPALVDDQNTVTATPIDRVYEHGFFPLENSFRANIGKNYEIFDQWTEILPTDQTVPIEVEYDPITGNTEVIRLGYTANAKFYE